MLLKTPNANPPQRIYFIAICGTAMASLAGMLKTLGHEVYGSDENIYPPMSTFLADHGIPVLQGFSESHLVPQPDLVVIGNAMSRGNPEVEYVLDHKIPYQSLPVVLKEYFLQGKTSLVVTGTHGKTTTSSLIAWLLEKNGGDPGFLIGGIPENFNCGYKVSLSHFFVVEGDEYDTAFFDKGPKFFHYLPDIVVINNIEFDHADIYNNVDEIKLNFRRLINLIPRNGLLIANGDDPNVRELLGLAFCTVATFGSSPELDWHFQKMTATDTGVKFSLFQKTEHFADFQIPLAGEHNVRNAIATIIAGNWLGYTASEMQAAFTTFKGVRRRLQLKAEINDILIFDDFAHHPTAIRETINGLRQRFPARRLIAVYEPRTATAKRNRFFNDYLEAFAQADAIIFSAIHRPDKVKGDRLLQVDELFQEFKARHKAAWQIPNVPQIVAFLKDQLQPGDVLLVMSNGSFDNIHEKLIQALK
ncbi:UDP-N-acetylmuramate:L-alanyl-gamma-D-glutamyl-meso-diaminopimelate ligase [candidate division KSB1 bacterium]|nr:UDP-N-acetylmuramate:L-alanyl-gamma-D-glutamyl-meso-diaminopimelate ligase [candidate division KSB1 bacterium]